MAPFPEFRLGFKSRDDLIKWCDGIRECFPKKLIEGYEEHAAEIDDSSFEALDEGEHHAPHHLMSTMQLDAFERAQRMLITKALADQVLAEKVHTLKMRVEKF